MRLALLSVGTDPADRRVAAGLDGWWTTFAQRQVAPADPASTDAALDELLGRLDDLDGFRPPGRSKSNKIATVGLPGRSENRPRLVIDADLAGLALVLARLMRRGVLGELDTAVLPREPIGYLTACGLPSGFADQLQVCVTGRSRLVGVVKDDSGGVCVDSALLTGWQADQPWWVRAVVDDQRLCDGEVRSVRLRRLGPDELQATAVFGRWRRRTCRGRSLQLACDPAQIVADGTGRAQPRSKRTFWSEPKLWRLALPD